MTHNMRQFKSRFHLSAAPLLYLVSIASAQNVTLYTNGKIYQSGCSVTVKTGSKLVCNSHTYAEAMAVKEDKIVAVGPTTQLQKSYPGAETFDLKGRLVLPGFNDAHGNLAAAGLQRLGIDLYGARSLDDARARINVRVVSMNAQEWAQGRGWDETLWPGSKLPTRQDIDAVTKRFPAVFTRVDGSIALVNSVALKVAGIDRNTPDPPGGKIDRDANGEPTGILRGRACDPIYALADKPSVLQLRKSVVFALGDAARWGITSVQDNSSWDDFLIYERLQKESNLRTRITAALPFDESLEKLKEHQGAHDPKDPLLHFGMVRGVVDGAFQPRTAALTQPYSDDASYAGLPEYDAQKLKQMVIERAEAGLQIALQASGDRAIAMALDAYEAAAKSKLVKPAEFRPRIERGVILSSEDIARLTKLKAVVSAQPISLQTTMNFAMERLGERAKKAYPLRSLFDAGVSVAFGSDNPVDVINPLRGIYAAITRKSDDGMKEFSPEQKISIQQAIYAYTEGAAQAEFAEKLKGRLSAGFLADFIVLDRDITNVPAEQLLETKVLYTFVGGVKAFEMPNMKASGYE